MPIIKVRFIGLCGFVPKKAGYASQNQVRVLFVNAGTLPVGGAYHGHEAHIPILRCETRLVVTTGVDPNGKPLRKPDFSIGGESYFLLSEQDVEITGLAKDQLSFTYGAGGADCHSTGDLHNCEWLAKLRTLGGNGTLQPDCLDNSGGAVNVGVAGRFSLTQGKLSNYSLAKDPVNRVIHWQFKPVGGTGTPLAHTQVLSEAMEYDHSTGSSSVDIKTSLMPGRTASSYLLQQAFSSGIYDLWIRLDPGGGDVEVSVLNLPLADLLGARPVATTGPHGPDHHFERYYDLVATPGTKRVPWAVGNYCPGAGGPGAGNPQCPGAEYEADGNA